MRRPPGLGERIWFVSYRLFRQRSPKTIALSAELETSMPDLAFVNAHRVPFQYQQYVQEHLGGTRKVVRHFG